MISCTMPGQLVALFWLALIVAAHDVGDRPFSRTSLNHDGMNYLPRQIATASSFASINWGASSAAGAPTTTAVASTLISPSNSTAGIMNAIISIAPSTLFIHITALPLSTSTSVAVPPRYHKRDQRTSNLAESLLRPFIIIPISACLGFVHGIISTWSYIKLRKRCRRSKGPRARSSSLEPGPPYISTRSEYHTHDNEFYTGQNPSSIALYDGGSPSKYSIHGSVYNASRNKSWLKRVASRHSRQSDTYRIKEDVLLWPPQFAPTMDREDDPFLAPPSRCASTRTAATKMTFRSAKEEEILPYDASEQKHYRQGLLERLKFGTMGRGQRPPAFSPDRGEYEEVQPTNGAVPTCIPGNFPAMGRSASQAAHYSRRRDGYRRSDSDVSVGEVRLPERTYSPAASPSKKRSVVRPPQDDTEWVAGRGFRLVEEGAPCGPFSAQPLHVQAQEAALKEFPSQDKTQSMFADGRSSSAFRGPDNGWLFGVNPSTTINSLSLDIDRYTVLPVRKTKMIKSGMNTPILTKSDQSLKATPFHRPHSSTVVPLSLRPSLPPPLESQSQFCSPFIPPSHSIPVVPPKFQPRQPAAREHAGIMTNHTPRLQLVEQF